MMRRLLIALLALAFLQRCALADDVVRPIRTAGLLPWATTPYDLALLHEALERTRPDFGAYEEQPFTGNVSDARAIQLAIEGRLVNLYPAGVGQPVPEREMIAVPFPIDKGLLGYRVALIDQRNRDRLSRVQSIEDLRELRVGQGSDWTDVRIYQHNRIPVETAPDYESLFVMLQHERFDLFPRGLFEVARELAAYGKRYPGFEIEQHLLLQYPFCKTYYVSRSAPRLAARLTTGLERMVADGSFDALFAGHYGKTLADLNLNRRLPIKLENPFLPAWVPLGRKQLWFDPARMS
jgi:hypothetical protein